MNCTYCGCEMEDGTAICPNCGAEKGKVQVLTPEEREDFQGLTISDEPESRDYEYKSADGRRRVYVHQVDLGKSPPRIIYASFDWRCNPRASYFSFTPGSLHDGYFGIGMVTGGVSSEEVADSFHFGSRDVYLTIGNIIYSPLYSFSPNSRP